VKDRISPCVVPALLLPYTLKKYVVFGDRPFKWLVTGTGSVPLTGFCSAFTAFSRFVEVLQLNFTVVVCPCGFTVPFKITEVAVTEVAGSVVTAGALADNVVKFRALEYSPQPALFFARTRQ